MREPRRIDLPGEHLLQPLEARPLGSPKCTRTSTLPGKAKSPGAQQQQMASFVMNSSPTEEGTDERRCGTPETLHAGQPGFILCGANASARRREHDGCEHVVMWDLTRAVGIGLDIHRRTYLSFEAGF